MSNNANNELKNAVRHSISVEIGEKSVVCPIGTTYLIVNMSWLRHLNTFFICLLPIYYA